MPDLDELGEALLPGAQRIGGAGGGPISWVRVMTARVPAFDALEAGDLAIVPAAALAVVAPGADELRALVDACVAARLSGLLLVEGDEAAGTGPSRGDVPGDVPHGPAAEAAARPRAASMRSRPRSTARACPACASRGPISARSSGA